VSDIESADGLLESAERLLDGVDGALARLASGEYGRCASCGEPIEDGVLASDPTSTSCAAHGGQPRAEQ
jgi:RNA polymerase-binding transcription factor DksA